MIETVNRIYFKQSDFSSLDEMYQEMYSQQLALLRNHYSCVTYKSVVDNNIYVLEFASLNPTFNQSKVLPCWITASEATAIAESRMSDYSQSDIDEILKDDLKLNDDDDDKSGGKGDA